MVLRESYPESVLYLYRIVILGNEETPGAGDVCIKKLDIIRILF